MKPKCSERGWVPRHKLDRCREEHEIFNSEEVMIMPNMRRLTDEQYRAI